MKIKRRKVPAIVGLAEAARLLGMKKENVRRLAELPEPANDRGIEGFEVSATPIWPRIEIEELAANRAANGHGPPPVKKKPARRAKAKRARRAKA